MPGLPEDYPDVRMAVHEISTFAFQSSAVRIVDANGEPWFVGKDVCAALGHAKPLRALSRLDADERATVELPDAMGRLQLTTIISQAAVWRLGLTSRVPAAKAFQRDLVHVIIPEWYRSHAAPAAPASPPATAAEVPLSVRMAAADDLLVHALDADWPADYIARVARFRAQVALGKRPAAPRPPRQLALPAPAPAPAPAGVPKLPAPQRVATVRDLQPFLDVSLRYDDGRMVPGWIAGQPNPAWYPAKREHLRALGYVVPDEVYARATVH